MYCYSGWPIQNHPSSDASGWTFVSPAKPIICNGEVSEWRYLAKQLHPFQAVIWRPVDAFESRYKVVGINNIPKGSAIDQTTIYSVPSNERISVKAGDMIGWSFGGPAGVIAASFDSKYAAQVKMVKGASLDVNQSVDFKHTQDRAYSIEVTVIQGLGI